MAKGGKKAPASVAGMKPITAFFPRKPRLAPMSSSATIPSAVTPSETTSGPSLLPPEQGPIKVLRRSTRLSEEPRSISSPPIVSTMRLHSPISALSPSPSHSKRKAKFDSDSDEEQSVPPAVVYVKSSVRERTNPMADELPTPLQESDNCIDTSDNVRKKPRLSPDMISGTSPLVHGLSSEELPSLVASASYLATPAYSGQNNIATGSLTVLDKVSTCSPASSDLHRSDALTPSSPEIPFGSVFDIPTPPLTDAASDDFLYAAPPSPVALDSATKTAKLIAEIREQAFAKFSSSPEQLQLLDLSDLDDSSDDDLPPLSLNDVKPVDDKGKFKAKETSPVLASSTQLRYSLRNRIASSPTPIVGSSSTQISTHQNLPSHRSISDSKSKKMKGFVKPQIRFNPLDELLKEKRLADKRGKGEKALLIAEEAALKLARGTLLDEMDDEEDISCTGRLSAIPSLDANGFLTDEVSLAEEDRKRLFGEDGGKDIMNILQSDKEKKAREKANQKIAGVPLWRNIGSAKEMLIDFTPPGMNNASTHPILQMFDSALRDRDYITANILLGSGALSTTEVARESDFINYLFELAFSLEDDTLSLSAFYTLTQIWGQTCQKAGLSFSAVSRFLVHFGADSEIMKDVGWETGFSVCPSQRTQEQREDILYRFVRCLSSSATCTKQEEIPDFISALLLIGMDSTPSSELRQDIITAINSICTSVSSDDDVLTRLETAVVNKALTISKKYEPVNKAYLVSYLASGAGRTRRIAQWIAHCMIVGKMEVSLNEYSELPSLPRVIEQLTDMASESVFVLHENTDYVDLGFHIYLFGVVMSNMKGYVEQEKTLRRQITEPLVSPGKSLERPETDLQLIREALERLHGRISDTRAAHLEPLSMRIYYQRETLLRSSHLGSGGKPRPSLRQYFTPKPAKQ
ncbi:hypothetical protein BDQ17DRAFT_1343807 [Cyathus striatus]|nr:hypothetical protein BDQ17DRAFT_1343807 [Cyathus striatus]